MDPTITIYVKPPLSSFFFSATILHFLQSPPPDHLPIPCNHLLHCHLQFNITDE
ncbi:hypothetical protein Hanom_Chr05g00410811 [Helianthus anomalus]